MGSRIIDSDFAGAAELGGSRLCVGEPSGQRAACAALSHEDTHVVLSTGMVIE